MESIKNLSETSSPQSFYEEGTVSSPQESVRILSSSASVTPVSKTATAMPSSKETLRALVQAYDDDIDYQSDVSEDEDQEAPHYHLHDHDVTIQAHKSTPAASRGKLTVGGSRNTPASPAALSGQNPSAASPTLSKSALKVSSRTHLVESDDASLLSSIVSSLSSLFSLVVSLPSLFLSTLLRLFALFSTLTMIFVAYKAFVAFNNDEWLRSSSSMIPSDPRHSPLFYLQQTLSTLVDPTLKSSIYQEAFIFQRPT